MDTLHSRRNTTTTIPISAAVNNSNSFWSPFTSISLQQQQHPLFGFSGAHPPPPPYTSPIAPPTPTYSSLPPPQYPQYHHSNPPLLPLPFSRSTSLPTQSPPRVVPPHRRASGRAGKDNKRPNTANSKLKMENQQVQGRASFGFKDKKELVESPPPSSLPLPRFSLRPKATGAPTCNAQAMGGGGANDGGVAAEELLSSVLWE